MFACSKLLKSHGDGRLNASGRLFVAFQVYSAMYNRRQLRGVKIVNLRECQEATLDVCMGKIRHLVSLRETNCIIALYDQ